MLLSLPSCACVCVCVRVCACLLCVVPTHWLRSQASLVNAGSATVASLSRWLHEMELRYDNVMIIAILIIAQLLMPRLNGPVSLLVDIYWVKVISFLNLREQTTRQSAALR